MVITSYREFKWCPETDLNRRHADFQSGAIPEKSTAYRSKARQTADGTSNTYTPIVKPGLARLTNENAATSAKV
ncbi:hypothetical protein, partial [Thioclava dalianensis]|uniref:hypothetical protein n=1 Tax=Thioclava dalianensis TaxID=1185766 RepID=UPI001B809A31